MIDQTTEALRRGICASCFSWILASGKDQSRKSHETTAVKLDLDCCKLRYDERLTLPVD